MDLKTVITNLENTIRGKERFLDDMIGYHGVSTTVSREFLRINIAELCGILHDLKQIAPCDQH
jgi:hypothetical protein